MRAVRSHSPMIVTLRATITELRAGLCRTELRARRRLCCANGALDTAAISALAQLAANLVVETSIPDSMLWIPRGLTIEHLAPTSADVWAVARLDKRDWADSRQSGVPVTVVDAAQREVARAVVSFEIAARKD